MRQTPTLSKQTTLVIKHRLSVDVYFIYQKQNIFGSKSVFYYLVLNNDRYELSACAKIETYCTDPAIPPLPCQMPDVFTKFPTTVYYCT